MKFCLALAFAAFFPMASPAIALAASAPVEHPCTYAALPARCGTFEVPEDRTKLGGRTISLKFVVVPAAHPAHQAVFPIAGGPGQSIVLVGAGYVGGNGVLAALHATHDFVFLDQRGTGGSHPLNCDLFADPMKFFAAIFPPDVLAACRKKLAQTSDLNAYGSAAAADDLDALRKALGYDRIILYGGSYGTTESLVYLRRHGSSVQNAVLEGVAPPFFILPLPFLQGAQHAFDDLATACAKDAICGVDFPNFRAEFAALLDQSTKGIPIHFVDPGTNDVVTTDLMRPVFADRMRQAMYSPVTAAFLPLIVHLAAGGDTTPLAKLVALLSRGVGGSLAMGENISVDCQESVPFVTDAAVGRESRGSFMANTIVNARRASCDVWKVRPVDPSFVEPVRSNVPVLMMSGQDDPATPAQYGTRELAYLSNGRQILIPNGGHDNDDPCLANIEIQFMKTSSAAGLDASCAQKFTRPPFATELPEMLR